MTESPVKILIVRYGAEESMTAGEEWDATVEIDVKGQILSTPVKSIFTRIYSSHDWDAACDANDCVPDSTLPDPWED